MVTVGSLIGVVPATDPHDVPFHLNSDDFVFDSQFLVQSVHFGFKIGDIPAPVRYFDEASSINSWAATKYAVSTLWTFVHWYLYKLRFTRSELFMPNAFSAATS